MAFLTQTFPSESGNQTVPVFVYSAIDQNIQSLLNIYIYNVTFPFTGCAQTGGSVNYIFVNFVSG